MAREHARIWLDINDDEDFAALSPMAQWFFLRVLLTEATLNYCGVADWRPKRLVRKAAGLTVDVILACAAELEHKRYALFDLDTEEVLVRSYVRRDELLRNPKMAATVIKAYPAVASATLRAGVVTELLRVKDEHPEYSSWEHKDTAAGLSRLLSRAPLAEGEYTDQYTYPNPVQNGDPNPVQITNAVAVQNSNPDTVSNTDPDPGADNQSVSVPIPSTSTIHPSPAPSEGYVTGERHQADQPDPNDPPPRYCPKHMPAGTDDPCGGCKTQRKIFDRWLAAQDVDRREAEQAKARAEAADRAEASASRALAIAACEICDDDGYTPDGRVCNHNPDQAETNARGMAAVRAALAKAGDA